MLFFDLTILEAGTSCDPPWLVTALYKFWKGQLLPRNITESYKPLPNMRSGSSFLLNPRDLFKDRSVDYSCKAQYIRLAGRRNFADYKSYSQVSLDTSYFPDLDIKALQYNPLLTLNNNHIHFKYER